MMRIFSLAVLSVLMIPAGSQAATVEEALDLERAGQTADAQAALIEAAADSAQGKLALAEFLDRRSDPAAAQAYRDALEAASDQAQRAHAARRLGYLELLAGNRSAADEAFDQLRRAGGTLPAGAAAALNARPIAGDDGNGVVEIPGLINSFLRMAALSTDLEPEQLLPALARNIVTGGYRAMRGGESLQETEYLKLVKQYLSQARELTQFAGADRSIDVPTCESEETAQLLKILGYRLRGECGPEAVLETVNPSRAFLSIDSAFPLADLEEAYRREQPFHLAYAPAQWPVLFGPEYWVKASDAKDSGEFIDIFLNDPALARLYVALAKMHRPTALALKDQIPAERLKTYANVLDFFGASFELRNGAARTPGSARAWQDLTGVAPSKGVEFYGELVATDDGWLASYYDALSRTQEAKRTYFTDPARMQRFYGALKGQVTSPGPARPIFRATAELLLLTSRLPVQADGSPVIPGGLQPWKDLFSKHPHGKYDGKLTKSAEAWKSADDLVEALFAMSRKIVENEPLKIFLAVANLDAVRESRLQPGTVERLILAFPEYGGQYSIFTEATRLRDETIIAYLDTAAAIDDLGRLTRRSNAVGTYQSLTALWQILVRQDQIGSDQADAALQKLTSAFSAARSEREIFIAGRAGLTALVEAAGGSTADPQQSIIELLAGDPGSGERAAHEQIVERLNGLFNSQRLVSLDALFDLADHLERVSRGESFNVAMANRLAATISEVPLPQAQLSTAESNAFGRGDWVESHIRGQRALNLRRSVDKAQNDAEKLADIIGEIAPTLRDTLVGLVYVYYSPPGAELIRANPLFVRSHDFLGPDQENAWKTPRLMGQGWPHSSGGRLIGSITGLAYALNDAEQNFLIPSERQALIWQDLAPQVLLGATVPRWWKVQPSELHYVNLHLGFGRSLVAAAALDEGVRSNLFERLGRWVEPARIWAVEHALSQGDAAGAVAQLTPSELYQAAGATIAEQPEVAKEIGAPFVPEIERLAAADPQRMNAARTARLFGMPHPQLARSYRPDLLALPLFPTVMGYSSRVLAESWESTNLYWAALADQTHLPPAELNLRVPEWTRGTLERIFATHLEDWPALLRSMKIVGERYQTQAQAAAAGGRLPAGE